MSNVHYSASPSTSSSRIGEVNPCCVSRPSCIAIRLLTLVIDAAPELQFRFTGISKMAWVLEILGFGKVCTLPIFRATISLFCCMEGTVPACNDPSLSCIAEGVYAPHIRGKIR